MSIPLPQRIRPQTLDDIYGQRHLLGDGKILRKIIESGQITNMIFYGPPGIGKTTLASYIANSTKKRLHKLNGTTASISDIKSVVEELDTLAAPNGILLYLDEIQYFNKKQQQTLLEYIENGKITLIASTTENPYFTIYGAILSRSTVFEFKPLDNEDICHAIRRAVNFLESEKNVSISISEEDIKNLAESSVGDVRKSLTTLELAFIVANNGEPVVSITGDILKELTHKTGLRYDRNGDEHYDILSAFQKSMRGSDPDAAIHYLARLLEAGDLISVCRRLLVCAAEDVGLAYPMIIPIVKAAVDSAVQLGLPEARIPLADAVILVATSPKSNTANVAIDAAISDIRNGKIGEVPNHLRDAHYPGAQKMNRGITYIYPHNCPNRWTQQQYLPDLIKNKTYYSYGENKTEQTAKTYWSKIKSL